MVRCLPNLARNIVHYILNLKKKLFRSIFEDKMAPPSE